MQSESSTDMSINRKLKAMDYQLSFLATKAAVEIQTFAENRRDDLPALGELANLIGNSFEIKVGVATRSLVNSSTASVLSSAIIESDWSTTRPKSIDDLASAALNIAEEMKSSQIQSERNGELSRLRDFCIALANCSMSYRKAILGPKRKHPFRK